MNNINFQEIDDSINAAREELAHENTLLADTPRRVVQRVVRIFRGVKPFLSAISRLPFIPSSWGEMVKTFINSLDALAVTDIAVTDVTTAFKAGKDLDA